MEVKKAIFAIVALSLLLAVSISVHAATVSQIGTITSPRGWLFSQSTLSGIYYGFGWIGGYPPASDIYYYNFLTQTNTAIKTNLNDPLVWGDTLYSTIIGDKIYIANFYNPYNASQEVTYDENGLYAIDTKTNTFYLYDRLPFDFFVNNWPSPMAAVGTDLYFFVGIPDRPDIASRVYKYNPSTKQVTNLTDLPKGLGSGGIVYAVGTNIYITTYNWGSENSIYVYDTLKNDFTYLATSSLIPSNNYRSNSVINGKLYFVGGEEPISNTALDKVVEYDPATNQFSIIETLTSENKSYGLMGASTTSAGGSLYVVGGEKVQSPAEPTNEIIKIVIDPVLEIANSCPANGSYKNHGEYTSCVSKKAEEFFNSGLITDEQKDEIVSSAAKSSVGKKNR